MAGCSSRRAFGRALTEVRVGSARCDRRENGGLLGLSQVRSRADGIGVSDRRAVAGPPMCRGCWCASAGVLTGSGVGPPRFGCRNRVVGRPRCGERRGHVPTGPCSSRRVGGRERRRCAGLLAGHALVGSRVGWPRTPEVRSCADAVGASDRRAAAVADVRGMPGTLCAAPVRSCVDRTTCVGPAACSAVGEGRDAAVRGAMGASCVDGTAYRVGVLKRSGTRKVRPARGASETGVCADGLRRRTTALRPSRVRRVC